MIFFSLIFSHFISNCEGRYLEISSPNQEIPSGPLLLMQHADWCGHCKRLLPEFKAAAEEISRNFQALLPKEVTDNLDPRSFVQVLMDVLASQQQQQDSPGSNCMPVLLKLPVPNALRYIQAPI